MIEECFEAHVLKLMVKSVDRMFDEKVETFFIINFPPPVTPNTSTTKHRLRIHMEIKQHVNPLTSPKDAGKNVNVRNSLEHGI